MKRQFLSNTVSFLFIMLFMYAATSKLSDYKKFRSELSQSPILTIFASWLTWTVPIIEIALAVLLSVRYTRLYGLYGSYLIMLTFSIYIVLITRYSEFIPCSCGGVLQQLSWNQHLVFNIAFTLLALNAILLYPQTKNVVITTRDNRKPVKE